MDSSHRSIQPGFCRASIGIALVLAFAIPPINARAACSIRGCNPVTAEIAARQGSSVRQLISTAIQQATSSLPPSGGQSFVIAWDPVIDTYDRSPYVGPISFRTPDTIGERRFALRGGFSFFEISNTFKEVDYEFRTANEDGSLLSLYSQFGLSARAKVGLLNVSLTYGWTDRMETSLTFPVSIVEVKARHVFMANREGIFEGVVQRDELATFRSTEERRLVDAPLREAGASDFPDSTQVGLGRVSLGAKIGLLTKGPAHVAFAPEIFFPSPSVDELAGPGSFAILPRMIASLTLGAPWAKLLMDVGYDYDFDVDELRRFTWNAGSTISRGPFTFDAGIGGSKYNSSVEWTAQNGTTREIPGLPPTSYVCLEDISVGDTTVDFLGGFRIALDSSASIGASVSVPLEDIDFQRSVSGTVAVEYYF